MPITSSAPGPRMARALRRKALASCGSKFPSVEPGKNPTFGMSFASAGSSNGAVKSAVTGNTFSAGKSARNSAACALRKSPEISTGT